MKTVYLFDAITGLITGEWQAQESPLEKGVFITPVYSTDKEPPTENKKIAKFDGENWTLLPNLKGEKYWLADGTEQEITEAGIALPANALLEKPKPPEIPPPTPAELFNQATEEVRASLQGAIDAVAREYRFSGGNSLMLYAGFLNAFQPLALSFAKWEANVWVEAETYREQVLAGTQPILSGAEAVMMMPDFMGV